MSDKRVAQMTSLGTPVPQLISRALSALRGPSPETGKTVHLALSGGVDSSVAGFLLRERGWDVRPVLMRCWADPDDTSEESCFDRDLRKSEDVVKALNLTQSLAVFDFVSEYWNNVFDGVLLSGLAAGVTPNQDLACNRFIKFGSFPQRLAVEGGLASPPPFATGHYARIRECSPGARGDPGLRLLRAADNTKDQTYFLASVPGAAFKNAIFPIGELLKREVRQIAEHVNLPCANSRSSRGICFVGKRPMADFMSRFMNTKNAQPGGDCSESEQAGSFLFRGRRICDVPHSARLFTIGQRARIGGASRRFYVSKKSGADVILVDKPPTTKEIICQKPHWIVPSRRGDGLPRLGYKGNSSAGILECFSEILGDGRLRISFDTSQPLIAPGQAIVLYDGDEVLGSAIVDSFEAE